MDIAEYLSIGAFGLTIASVTIGTTWKLGRDLQVSLDGINAKRTRIYERIDEEKQKSDVKYTNKEICSLRHSQLDKTISEMSDDVKELLRTVKSNGSGNK